MSARFMAALLALMLTLAGCSASTGSSGSDGAVDMAEAPAADDAGGMDADADGMDAEQLADVAEGESAAGAESGQGMDVTTVEASDGATGGGGDGEAAQMMVHRATLEVQVDDVTQSATKARATATGSGGWVESEEVVPGDEDRAGYASLVLRVPSEGLDSVLASLGELGTVTSSRTSADNVAAEYRDVEARIATLEASADRLRDLIGEATGVESIANLERELSEREANLDGLKARLKVLADDVARSTITLHLAEDRADLGQAQTRTGFVGGLQQGWDAFLTSVTYLVTALGALLPFLAVAALVLVPVLWWRRNRRTSRATPVRGGKQAGSATTGASATKGESDA